jgi:hypothetical protein
VKNTLNDKKQIVNRQYESGGKKKKKRELQKNDTQMRKKKVKKTQRKTMCDAMIPVVDPTFIFHSA